jgi:hypothetical protein
MLHHPCHITAFKTGPSTNMFQYFPNMIRRYNFSIVCPVRWLFLKLIRPFNEMDSSSTCARGLLNRFNGDTLQLYPNNTNFDSPPNYRIPWLRFVVVSLVSPGKFRVQQEKTNSKNNSSLSAGQFLGWGQTFSSLDKTKIQFALILISALTNRN